MKILKILAAIFAVGMLLQVYAYYNLTISYKYEVDLTETAIHVDDHISSVEKIKRTEQLDHRRKEIEHQKTTTKVYFGLFFLGLLLLLYFIISRTYSKSNVSTDARVTIE